MEIVTGIKFSARDSSGNPLSGGKVYSYTGGTSTPTSTYPTTTDARDLTNANANPVILDSKGEAFIVCAGLTKLVLKDSSDATIDTFDNIGLSSTDISAADGSRVIQISSVSSAVNYLKATNAATGNAPELAVAGTDSNINMNLTPKGTGVININGPLTASGGAVVLRGLTYPSADSTSGHVIKTNGSGTLSFGAKISSVTVQTFTSSGTYTPTAGTVFAMVFIQGAGGGGGGASTGAGQYGAGSGGHAAPCDGGFIRTAAQIGASATVTIGAGGTGGTAGNNGNAGGNTSVAFSAGTVTVNGANGGTASNNNAGNFVVLNANSYSDATFPGCGNGRGENGWAANALVAGGNGGFSCFGAGGVGGMTVGAGVAGGAAVSEGAGGGGGASYNASNAAGGDGRGGRVTIIDYVSD